MIELVRRLCKAIPTYAWSGWGALASLMLFVALWEGAAGHYGALILPAPQEVAARLLELASSGSLAPSLLLTARRALSGLALATGVGVLVGGLAGLSLGTALVARPWITLLLGMPPIAWLVLAMLWFGTGDGTPVFTVFVACLPLVFAAALQGVRTLDSDLKDMARAFKLPWRQRMSDLYFPHLLSYLFPALITALGSSWKVAVMAELLAASDGIGAELALSRAHLDMSASMAWIGAVVAALLMLEYGVLEPIKRELERWRDVGT